MRGTTFIIIIIIIIIIITGLSETLTALRVPRLCPLVLLVKVRWKYKDKY